MYLEVYFSVQPYGIPAYGFLFPVMGGDVAEHNSWPEFIMAFP